MGNAEQAFLIAGQRGVALARNYGRVLGTDLEKQLAVFVAIKSRNRVGATQRERMAPRQFIPELFEPQGGLGLALSPQQRDHLAESDHPRRPARDRTPSAPQH